jgi:hypothetical protein
LLLLDRAGVSGLNAWIGRDGADGTVIADTRLCASDDSAADGMEGLGMIRLAGAVAMFVLLTGSPVLAQEPAAEFTVSVASAAVRKAPSTGSPVIGQAPRGTVLVVARDIGAWVKVAWPDAEDGTGYVHQTMGKVSQRPSMEERLASAFTPSPEAAPAQSVDTAVMSQDPQPVPLSSRSVYVAAPTHFVGLGGRVGGASRSGPGSPVDTFGVSARVWSRKRLGVQLDASRSKLESGGAPARATVVQFSPSAIYSLTDRVTDYVWVRPYVGGGGVLSRSTLKGITPDDRSSIADTSYGVRTFGGAELAFPSVPRFAVSADLGYLWSQESFEGFELSGVGISVAAHWYFR